MRHPRWRTLAGAFGLDDAAAAANAGAEGGGGRGAEPAAAAAAAAAASSSPCCRMLAPTCAPCRIGVCVCATEPSSTRDRSTERTQAVCVGRGGGGALRSERAGSLVCGRAVAQSHPAHTARTHQCCCVRCCPGGRAQTRARTLCLNWPHRLPTTKHGLVAACTVSHSTMAGGTVTGQLQCTATTSSTTMVLLP